ncbi:MAG: gamma-butyrobetaine hydroxylase-like domain-containing protein [Acidiferrobacterales bacterium]
MTTDKSGPTPTEIALQKKSNALKITFNDGSSFELPSRYLRMFSPAAEARIARDRGDEIVTVADVHIEQIEPVGSYAVRLVFSDGHETGVYSWSTLYELGDLKDKNWPPEKDAEKKRETDNKAPDEIDDKDISQWRTINILYFGTLVDQIDRDREEVKIPPSVTTVQALIDWLAERGTYWDTAIRTNPVKVTVNRQFAEAEVPITEGDEVAFVPIAAGKQ